MFCYFKNCKDPFIYRCIFFIFSRKSLSQTKVLNENTESFRKAFCRSQVQHANALVVNNFLFFFYLAGFSFTNIHDLQESRGVGRQFFNSSLPLSPTSEALIQLPNNHCRKVIASDWTRTWNLWFPRLVR